MRLALRSLSARLTLALFVLSLSAPLLHADEAREAVDPEEQAKALIDQMKSKDIDLRRDAAEKAAKLQDKRLTSPLIKLLADSQAEVRISAIEALGTRNEKGEARKAASALASRFKRYMTDKKLEMERDAAIDALHALAQPTTIKKMLDTVDLESDPEVAADVLMAVANVPSDDAIERLIQFLDRGRRAEFRRFKAAAGKALQWATGVKGNGHNPDAWRAWWRGAKKDYDHKAAANQRAAVQAEADEKAARAEERREKRKARERDPNSGKRQKKAPESGGGESDA